MAQRLLCFWSKRLLQFPSRSSRGGGLGGGGGWGGGLGAETLLEAGGFGGGGRGESFEISIILTLTSKLSNPWFSTAIELVGC